MIKRDTERETVSRSGFCFSDEKESFALLGSNPVPPEETGLIWAGQ